MRLPSSPRGGGEEGEAAAGELGEEGEEDEPDPCIAMTIIPPTERMTLQTLSTRSGSPSTTTDSA
jgi:hypothetical protein